MSIKHGNAQTKVRMFQAEKIRTPCEPVFFDTFYQEPKWTDE